ncbi:nuclear transport factor 2 family protein [Streptomyces sp. UNOC14_S4]|uniref:YybH family protein n=1 Tax=Streptomyces sp. UNOC14_S4 TaxID=2872340 RepID=UPI001E58CD61|nr:nuclear transport factor 2 family protein [Streptomyces sp. UNOC14_S4]MCC3772443.1 nuclear transport factor 2 family protein [Streptomyces sp. UNOC14_S4]
MTENRAYATTPEDITRLFVERANAGDADGMAALYAPDAVLAFPPDNPTVGRDAIRAVCEKLLAHATEPFVQETPLPTIYYGDDLALTSTPSSDNTGGRVQVVRRQPDGGWVRIIDRPETRAAR